MAGPVSTSAFGGTDRFRPRAVVGRGAMGVVYRVFDVETESEVALKTLDALAPDGVYALKQEFRTLAGITHRNLVGLYELVVADASCFFTMEYVDGVDFLTYVGAGDAGPARLVEATRQLVGALAAVHAAGKLHRDVKPSNVLVARDGRVVVLDFGLATALQGSASPNGGFSGTLPYAAPEQIWGGPRHAAADWYALGTMLYEAITGSLPFEGHPAQVAVAKTEGRPRPLGRLRADVPPALDALVLDLLDPDPGRRPGAEEIDARLGALVPGANRRVVEAPPRDDVPFVGRDPELVRLRAAFERGTGAVVEVSGPSGIGKTELVRRFLAELEATTDALVLRGRCHPQEAVPHNALDGIVDGLSLRLLAEADGGAALAPPQAESLVQLFPVLGRVAAFRDLVVPDVEPYEIRRRAIAALRELLGALAARGRVVVWIDDAQWADADSAGLLQEVLRAPGAPRALVLLTMRTGESALLPAAIAEVVEPERMMLGPLDAETARALAERLCARRAGPTPAIGEVVDQAAGSPFMISQLALTMGGASDVAGIVRERLAEHPPEARDLVDVVALAGGPLERDVALDAAGIGRRGRPLAYGLERTRLLRPAVLRADAGVEIYHDRIREAVVATLAGDRRRDLHARLAEAIERTPSPDPYALFTHHKGAGDAARASTYGERAADRAAEALAFDRAAATYRELMDIVADEVTRARLSTKRGHALAGAGRSAEAAAEYQAAGACTGSADPEQTFDLRRRAAEQWLRAGRLVEGVAGTRAVLAHVGVDCPASLGAALGQVVVQRLRRRWRGERFERRRTELPPVLRTRLDMLWGATVTLGTMDQLMADAIGVRHFIEALAAGDPVHAARAMGLEVAKAAQIGGARRRRRAASMLDAMRALVADGGRPYERAYLEIVSGVCAYQTARWREAYERCSAGSAILQHECTGVSWELATADAFALSALAYMGELRELGQRLPAAIRDAEDRGDLYASVGFRAGILNLMWLAEDRPEEARRQADDAIARWPGTNAFNVQHYLHLIASVHIDLYEGDPWAAWRRIVDAWPRARSALFLLMEAPRVELRFLRARAALACAAAGMRGGGITPADSRWPAERLLRLAAADAMRIARDRDLMSAAALSDTIRAGVAKIRGDEMTAARLNRLASSAFGAAHMRLHAAAAAMAAHSGGLETEITAGYLAGQNVHAPTRLLKVLGP